MTFSLHYQLVYEALHRRAGGSIFVRTGNHGNGVDQTVPEMRHMEGVDDAQLQLIYRAVVNAKLTCASSSWWGFTSASDRQRLEDFLRRGCRYGLYPADQPTVFQLIEEADETLFNSIRHNPLHILHPLLPKQIYYCYSLKP